MSTIILTYKEAIERRFLQFVNKDNSEGHWIWTGFVNDKGYGQFKIEVRGHWASIFASRASAYLYLDLDLDDGDQFALHKKECSLKSCVNPNHLYIGTHMDNAIDYSELKTYCTNGHEYTEENTLRFKRHNSIYRQCKECNKAAVLRYKLRKKSRQP